MTNRPFIEQGYAALSRRDLDAFVAQFTEDAEVRELEELPDTDVYVGHEGVRRWAEGGMEHTDEWTWQLEEVLHEDDVLFISRARLTGHGAGSGIPIEMQVVHLFEIRDGKVASVQGFLSEARAREVAGI